MFIFIRPDFEVVNEGRIFHFVSGSRRFVVRDRIILRVCSFITDEPTFKINHLQEKPQVVFYFTPGLRQGLDKNEEILTDRLSDVRVMGLEVFDQQERPMIDRNSTERQCKG
jgi:hypothetical protein